MASLNRVFLIGNLTRDPEIRHTPKGTAVGDLAMAINMSYRTAEGAEKEEVCYVDIVVWGRQAEICKDYLSKGSPIFVEGRLQLDQWESNQGEKRSRLRVRAERIQFLGRGSGSGGASRTSGDRETASPRHDDAPPARGREPEDFPDTHAADDEIPF
ncbi:MAG: single-stranded DNA-binding protein [Candidatus Methylacidiphilales bacterium]|nr:single-stranded DNA-binding protein [Candidatus Methylacidiphilales bacterium]